MADETTTTETDTTTTDPAAGNTAQGNGDPKAGKTESPAEKAMRQLSEEEYEDLNRRATAWKNYEQVSLEDPDAVLEDILTHAGPKARAALEARLAKIYEGEMEAARKEAELKSMTPEQKRVYELEQYKAKVEADKKAKEEADRAEAAKSEQIAVENDIKAAIEAGGFEPTALVAELARRAIELAVKNDVEYTPADIAAYVEAKLEQSAFSKIDKLEGEDLLNKIGEARLKKIHAAYKQKADKLRQAGVFTKPPDKDTPSGKKQKGPMYVDQRLRIDKELEHREPKMTSEQRLRKLWRDEE